MEMEEIVLKIKENETIEVLKYITIEYLIFLLFLGLIMGYQETVIQVTFMVVFAIIINSLNYGELVISEKGIATKSIGFLKYNKIYRVELKKRTLVIYNKEREKPYRIMCVVNEDIKQIQKVYKYIDSKIKRIEEDEKDMKEIIERYS